MVTARPDPDASFADAARQVVGARAAAVFAAGEHVLNTEDIEHVHRMRVATRRLRAALEIFAPCFPPRRHARLLGEVKELADALGARRDPDVQIATVRECCRGDAAARAGVQTLLAELAERQRDGNRRLERAIAAANSSDLEGRFAGLAAAAR